MALTKTLGGAGGGSLAVQEEGITTTASASTMNFVGAGVTATDVAGVATVTIPGATPAEVLITETVVGVATATITFSSIAATWRDLRLVVRGRSTAAGVTFVELRLQCNGDTAANYDWDGGGGAGAGAFGASGAAQTSAQIGWLTAATAPAGVAAMAEQRISNYRGTTFQKDGAGVANLKQANGAGSVFAAAFTFWWRSTSAITSVTALLSAGNFDVGTVASLYGVL